ncbi:MAG: shikimate kinase [Planctomycetaceae bacterium]|nr:shikimate kinase [Planctomycetaceae bacterium]
MLISLTGYRGTGKTTVGQLLAERLGWRCVDTDAEIESLMGRPIRQIFDDDGEQRFRDVESQIVVQMARQHKLILALGGGTIVRPENRQALQVAGPVVWLRATPETIYQRITDDQVSDSQRPNLTPSGGFAEIKQVLEERTPIYQASSDCIIDTDGLAPGDIADAILKSLDMPPQNDPC